MTLSPLHTSHFGVGSSRMKVCISLVIVSDYSGYPAWVIHSFALAGYIGDQEIFYHQVEP